VRGVAPFVFGPVLLETQPTNSQQAALPRRLFAALTPATKPT